jgi:cyclohexa-1,5-dienecarbonyl-CoA hydratase
MSSISAQSTHDNRVCDITLAGSRGNLITDALVAEFRDALRGASSDPKLKLVVIRGQGDNFSYGADVKEHLPEHIARVLPAFHALVGELLGCDVPTLARVSGFCLGGAFEIALACSMIWCDRTAKFGLPEISLGVFPPVAAVLLPERTSRKVAAELVLTGRVVAAMEARQLGFVNAISTRALLNDRINDFIVKFILPKSASSLRFANAALQAHIRRRYAEEIASTETLYLQKLMRTHDAVEGARAFLEKRVPDWKDA